MASVIRTENLYVFMPCDSIKVVRSLLPAYARYFDFVGVVLDRQGDSYRVCVYGPTNVAGGLALRRKVAEAGT